MTSFFRHRVSQCPIILQTIDNCLIFYSQRFTDIVLKLGKLVVPTNRKIVLQRQIAHADAVAGLPLPGLRIHVSAETVWSTRLQSFFTVLNFHPLSG